MAGRFENIAGFVLAGGASRRMGSPKDQLVIAGERMLDLQVRLLRSVVPRVAVIGPVGRLSIQTVAVFPDEKPGLGPLGGVQTALTRTHSEYNLVIGCDLPFLSARFLRFLCGQAFALRCDVTVPASPDGRLHPACAVYRRRARSAVRACLESGTFRVAALFQRVKCRVVPWPEIAHYGFRPRIFDNMNTPADYEAAKRRVEM